MVKKQGLMLVLEREEHDKMKHIFAVLRLYYGTEGQQRYASFYHVLHLT
jgi:hypothetical protein